MSDAIGIQAARAVLRDDPERAQCLYLQQGRRDARVNELIGLAKAAQVRFQTVPAAWFRRRLNTSDDAEQPSHQGVVLACASRAVADTAALYEHVAGLPHPALILVLDGITDPRNLGACIRSANGAGVDALVLPKRQSAPLNELASKTAQGGMEKLFIASVTNLARTLDGLKDLGLWVVGTADDAPRRYHQIDVARPLAVVLGGEDRGMRRLTRERCDELMSIPMLGGVESLNVAVATGVVLYDIVRQRS